MSKSNPEKALAALIPAPIRAGNFTVKPMTLGMFAALERIGSPLVTGKDAKDTLELIPSLYLLTHDPREIFAGNILDRAMEWANTVGMDAIGKIKAACDKQLKALFDVVPETPADEKKKKDTTAGSRAPRTSPPRSSAGASGKSSGKSPPRPSYSSVANRASRRTKSFPSR